MQTQNTGATDPKALMIQKIDDLKVAINDNYVQSQLKNALAENSGAFAASIIDLFSGDTYLQACNPKLVIMQAMKAAFLKLPINKSLGFAYIVPYNNVPQFQIGYKGLIQLAYRTCQYKFINCDVVYDGEFQSANKLTGEFDLTGMAKSETIVGYFAHFELLNGLSKTLYMTVDKVRAHAAKYSKSYNSNNSPWKSEFDAMAKKTVLRNLLTKWGYLNVEMANAMDSDQDNDAGDKVLEEIRGNANTTEMKFNNVQHAEVIPEGEKPPF